MTMLVPCAKDRGRYRGVYMLGVPRGIFSKYIPLENLQHLGTTIRLEGVVAA